MKRFGFAYQRLRTNLEGDMHEVFTKLELGPGCRTHNLKNNPGDTMVRS